MSKKDDCPQYKESFNFRLEPDEWERAGVKITCLQAQAMLEKGETKKNPPIHT